MDVAGVPLEQAHDDSTRGENEGAYNERLARISECRHGDSICSLEFVSDAMALAGAARMKVFVRCHPPEDGQEFFGGKLLDKLPHPSPLKAGALRLPWGGLRTPEGR